jgi:hypothetical protein
MKAMTKRPARIAAGVVALVVIAVAVTAAVGGGGESRGRPTGPFAWLHPSASPAGWKTARTPGGTTFAYPPGWKGIETDPGTASVALLGAGGRIDGYLNATPNQGAETLANWSRFRPEHNKGEGDRHERVVASTTNAHFRAGHGSCVIDTYTTSKAAYREIACLVRGARSTAVMVGAAPDALWDREAATLERAISSFVP